MTKNTQNYKTGQIRIDNQKIILQAAVQEFAQCGFKGASMMSIAKRAELPRPNLHYYFANKLELYQHVLMDILELWNAAFDEVSVEDDPGEAIGNYIHAKVMYSKTNPLSSKIFATEIIHGGPNLGNFLNGDYRQWLNEKTTILKQWSQQGKMDPVDPYHLIFMIWSCTQYYADFSVQIESIMEQPCLDDSQYQDVAATISHIILKGCGIGR
jgi:TetR/AcrR family transcriptional regulator